MRYYISVFNYLVIVYSVLSHFSQITYKDYGRVTLDFTISIQRRLLLALGRPCMVYILQRKS